MLETAASIGFVDMSTLDVQRVASLVNEQLWLIGADQVENLEAAKESIKNWPEGQDRFNLAWADLNQDQKLLVYGKSLEGITGAARVRTSLPRSSVGEASMFVFKGEQVIGDRAYYLDDDILNYETPCREQLCDFNGYNAYTGRGPVMHIDSIQTFASFYGIGSQILNEIKASGYELIELASASGVEQFYYNNGFKNSGLYSENSDPILVWHWDG